jgi:hypothetical protein
VFLACKYRVTLLRARGHGLTSRIEKRHKEILTAIFTINEPPGLVEERLQTLKGLVDARVNPVEGKVWVEFDPSIITEADIRQACAQVR